MYGFNPQRGENSYYPPYLTRNHFLNFCGWDTDFKSFPNLNCLLDILQGHEFEDGKYYYFSELLGLEDMLSCQDKRTFSDDFITNTIGHYQVLKFYFFYPFQHKDSMYAEDGKLNQEGDWEVVAVLLEDPASPKPVLVLATQETLGMALWGEISTEGDHPKIYVAKGGHENYFSPGCHERTGAIIIDDIIDRVEDAVGDEVDEKLDDVRDTMGDVGWGLIIAAIIAAIFGCFAAAAILGAAGGILVDKSDDIPDSEEIKDRIKDKIHDTLDTENCAPETKPDAFVIGKISGADTDWKTIYNGQDDRFRGGWLDRKDIWWNYRGLWGVRVVPHQEGSGKSGPRHPDHELLKIDKRIKEKVLAYLSSE